MDDVEYTDIIIGKVKDKLFEEASEVDLNFVHLMLKETLAITRMDESYCDYKNRSIEIEHN